MLTIKSTVVQKVAIEEVNGITYSLDYSIINGSLNSVTCNFTKKAIVDVPTPEGVKAMEQQIGVGNIILENDVVTSRIPAAESSSEFIERFEIFIEEIKNSIIS